MHNHNDGNQGHASKMMWLMMLPCLLIPIIFLLIAGKSFGSIAGSWQWLSPIVFMLGIHVLMMKFMHGHDSKSAEVDEKKTHEGM